MIGRIVGAYEITARIGAGGMGEVYRARDARLDRDVALKILPEAFASDPDRLMRFTREAKTLASLNHPNIAAIYGVEEDAASGQRALVMELVEGEDLSDRIARGPVPVDEAIALAKQIADALGAAHDAGIVHRDLKPANVKLRADGTIKVLDFGLAKAMSSSDSGTAANVAQSPTMTSPALTQMGLIIGTAAYMSPEQAKGRPVDRRADIWAFGVILHEMLSGRRLFEAEDVTETLAAVLTRDVSAASLPAHLPSSLRALVTDCLARDPKKRLRDISDIRLLLDKLDRAEPPAPAGAASAGRGAGWLWPALASVAVLSATGGTALYLNAPAAGASEVIAFEISAPNLAIVEAISPDGRNIVYATDGTPVSPSRLWIRSLESFEATPVPGTEEVRARAGPAFLRPTWAPDNRTLLVSGPDSLFRVDTVTGQRSTLVPRENRTIIPGGWSRDGVILYGVRASAGNSSGIWRVPATGGAPVKVTQLRPGDLVHVPAGFLPDGRRFVYLSVGNAALGGTDNEVRIGSIDAAPEAQSADVLLRSDALPAYADGQLLFVAEGSLMAQPFDPDRAVLSGSPVQLASGVNALVSVSENGRLAYRTRSSDLNQTSEIVRFHRSGRIIAKIGQPGEFGDVNVLPGGTQIAVSRSDAGGPSHLFVVDLARSVFTRLSPGHAGDYAAAPAPDGTIAYTFSPDGISRDIYVRAANGVGDPKRLVASDTVKHANGWSPDGRFLIYDDHTPSQNQDLFVVPREGGTPVPFLATAADETHGQFSPDGKWIVYASTESGRFEAYVRDFAPDRSPAYGTEKVQISPNGGNKPRWSADGTEIFFLQGSTMMAVKVRPGKPFQVSTPVVLFDTRPVSYIPYDVLPDGSFVVNNAIDVRPGAAPPIRVVLNWPALLQKSR